MTEPPIDPGIQDKNSRPPIPLSFAKSAILRSSVPAPTSIKSLLTNLIFEKFDPSFITTPFMPLSLIRVFEPAPRIVKFKLVCLLYSKTPIAGLGFLV